MKIWILEYRSGRIGLVICADASINQIMRSMPEIISAVAMRETPLVRSFIDKYAFFHYTSDHRVQDELIEALANDTDPT